MANIETLKQAARDYLRFLEDDDIPAADDLIYKARQKMLDAAMLWAQAESIENIKKPSNSRGPCDHHTRWHKTCFDCNPT